LGLDRSPRLTPKADLASWRAVRKDDWRAGQGETTFAKRSGAPADLRGDPLDGAIETPLEEWPILIHPERNDAAHVRVRREASPGSVLARRGIG
jgi:hypothetical protein